MRLWTDEIEGMRAEARQCVADHMQAVRAAYNDRSPLPPDLDRFERARVIRASFPAFPADPRGHDQVWGGMSCRVFLPGGAAPRAVYVHFHGGGTVFGVPEMNDGSNAAFALRHGVAVVSVRYRTAPEHPFPAALDDAAAVVRDVLERGAEQFGATELLLGGESAGAYLAVAAILRVRDLLGADALARVRAVKLSYGCYDWGRPIPPSDSSPILDAGSPGFFRECFLPDRSDEDRRDPHISPLFADLQGLPPALLTVGTEDRLLDDTLGLAVRWAAAGNETELFVAPDLPHAFEMFACGITAACAAFEGSWIEEKLAPRAQATEMEDSGTLHLDRVIPVPMSVSPEARAAMQAGCAGVAARIANPPQLPDRSDLDGWRARIAATDELMVSVFRERVSDDADFEVDDIRAVRVFRITPSDVDAEADAMVLLDIHGGALVGGGGEVCRLLSTIAAQRTGLVTWSVDYRMPPDHPYPAPLDDCLAVYAALLDEQAPTRIVVSGASAGGNLAAAMLLRARAEGLPMPAGLMLLSPEIDLTESGDTFATNQGVDYVLVDGLGASIALYAGDQDLSDPLLSPLFGDLAGFPKTLLQSGTRDLFLSNTVRMHRRLRDAGVDAELHVWEAMPHGGFFGAPEDAEIAVELRRFVRGLATA